MRKPYYIFLFSSDPVKSMSFRRRKCFMHAEPKDTMLNEGVSLTAFQNYSRKACLMECRAHLIYEQCGCLPYYYPNFAKIWQERTDCDLKGLECMHNETGKIACQMSQIKIILS